jgi:hypothetical protein
VKKLRNFLFVIAISAVSVVATSRASLALTFDFIGGYGGSISYSGGATSLAGAGLPIYSVFGIPPGFSSMYSIAGGSMSFSTGAFSGLSPSGGYTFGTGGSLVITGGISTLGIGAGSTLMTASFSSSPTFKYLGWSAGALTAGLSVNYLNSDLLDAFGLSAGGAGVGALTQLDIFINPSLLPFGPGVGFTATQAGATVTSTLALPEPGTLLLFGSGLTVFGLIGIRRSRTKKMEETDGISRLA